MEEHEFNLLHETGQIQVAYHYIHNEKNYAVIACTISDKRNGRVITELGEEYGENPAKRAFESAYKAAKRKLVPEKVILPSADVKVDIKDYVPEYGEFSEGGIYCGCTISQLFEKASIDENALQTIIDSINVKQIQDKSQKYLCLAVRKYLKECYKLSFGIFAKEKMWLTASEAFELKKGMPYLKEAIYLYVQKDISFVKAPEAKLGMLALQVVYMEEKEEQQKKMDHAS